ncbi:MAG: hypothetical protein IJ424_05630 [Oscillospiraceae bacterium]|nr:hypothetical protein [Oscillospiraceae bacterium]
MPKPFCKKCLLADIDIDGLYKQVSDLIAVMPDDVKVSSEVYNHRLETCKQCDRLENGICAECGCFVELRAASKRNYCPSVYKYW